MTSQMSQMKSITQINHTIESHKTGHEWDDVMHKIQKIHGSMDFMEIQIMGMENMQKNCQLIGKFHE